MDLPVMLTAGRYIIVGEAHHDDSGNLTWRPDCLRDAGGCPPADWRLQLPA